MLPIRLTVCALAACIALTAAPAWAAATPLELRKIMQELGRHMQNVAEGIAREDWARVEKVAPLIADHPQPPLAEKARILAFVGADTGRFRNHDRKTHEAAKAMGQAAANQDGHAVIAAFQALQSSCLDCHQAFRKPFVAHFYGTR